MGKTGLPSFLLDCSLDDKTLAIEAEFGAKGFAILVHLWQKIYAEEGYYCGADEMSMLLFSGKYFPGNSGVTMALINEVVLSAINRGIFDRQLYEKYCILTSRGIQKRYFETTKRRTELNVKNEYLLIDVRKINPNVNILPQNVNNFAENVNILNTSKDKGSKGKGSNIYMGNPAEPKTKEIRHKYGKYKNVLLTTDELENLKSEFPTDWENWIERVSEYCASTGKSYKNYLATIRNWAKKEKDSGSQKVTEQKTKFHNFTQSNHTEDELTEALRKKGALI